MSMTTKAIVMKDITTRQMDIIMRQKHIVMKRMSIITRQMDIITEEVMKSFSLPPKPKQLE